MDFLKSFEIIDVYKSREVDDNHLKRSLVMTKLFVHAKLLIDGINDTPKFDQLISIEDDKIKVIEDYHEIQEDVIEVNTMA